MNNPREQMLQRQKEEEDKRWLEIVDKPELTSEEIWLLTQKNYVKWCRIHYYPRLIKHFSEQFPLFAQWKTSFELTDNDIIHTNSISEFIGNKKLSGKKKKYLYLLEQTFSGEKRNVVCYENLEGKKPMFPESGESYKLKRKFIPFYDWLKYENKGECNLFNIHMRQAPNHALEKVWINNQFELLKVGGIKAPVNGFGILLRGKRFEFVNACGLKFEGDIAFGEEGNLEFEFCAVDNMKCENLKMPLLRFEYCSINSLSINNSTIESWRFWGCEIEGDILSTKLRNIQIWGGYFTPYLNNCNIDCMEASHKEAKSQNYKYTYNLLKKIYSDQGNDAEASKYYIRERELERQYTSKKKVKFWLQTISRYYWGYGKKPQNVIAFAFLTIMICALICYINIDYLHFNDKPQSNFDTVVACIYYSTVTFTTLGYGDIYPLENLRILTIIEAFLGALSLGFLVSGYSNSKY